MKLIFALFLAVFSCEAAPSATLCDNVPPGGCPLLHGTACDDPTCVAAYQCTSDGWEFDHLCPVQDASSFADATVADAGVRDVSDIDVPPGSFGGPGCEDLEGPDCTLGTALACQNGCCGCEDLFVCNNGGWDFWGECGDGGIIAATDHD